LQFLRFFKWKTDGKWKMENALVRKLLGKVRQNGLSEESAYPTLPTSRLVGPAGKASWHS
jgi:hypothetical protein